jgi:hypothetical protein
MKVRSPAAGRSEDERDAGRPGASAAFNTIAEAFQEKAGVTIGGKGFGSAGLKRYGKLFAMLSSKGQFVVKLPALRAQELARLGTGKPFDPGHGRLMKEWVALDDFTGSWPALAQEAYEYAATAVAPRKGVTGRPGSLR